MELWGANFRSFQSFAIFKVVKDITKVGDEFVGTVAKSTQLPYRNSCKHLLTLLILMI